MNPIISIIIPTFNSEKTIKETLNSVFCQTYKNIQVIVIDGDSTDNSKKIIQGFPNIYYSVSEKDDGIYDAMNKGINQATGDYLFFLGGDDYFYNEEVLYNIFNNFKSEKPKIVFGNVENINLESKKTPKFHLGNFSGKLKWKNTLHHQGTFYHKSIFNEFRYDPSLDVLGDYELNLKLLNENCSSYFIDSIITFCNADGASKNYSKRLYKEELIVKKRNMNMVSYLIQIPWVWLKFLYKNI